MKFKSRTEATASRIMHRVCGVTACAALFAALMIPGRAGAMEIRQFDKMADQDQSDYIGDLIVGAEKVLSDEGKADLAAKVKYLFTTKLGNDADVIGMVEVERNLAILRLSDLKHHAAKPDDPWLYVEDVMFSTMQKNHIELPDSFYTVMNNFHPKFPPKQ